MNGQNGGLPLTLTVAFTAGQHYRDREKSTKFALDFRLSRI